jgi:translation initiation factor 2 subunit 2
MADAPPPGADDLENELDALMGELKVKKSKKSKKKDAEGAGEAPPVAKEEGSVEAEKQIYSVLLTRVYDQLRANNPDLVNKKKAVMRPPNVVRVGTSRILWVNFNEICKMMKRDPDHVFRYFLTELGTTGSIDASQRFLMKGKFVPRYVESVLRRYIAEYVTCSMCRGVDTRLDRDPMTRMHFMVCETCGSSRSVAPIQKGFHATARGERRAARNAAEG